MELTTIGVGKQSTANRGMEAPESCTRASCPRRVSISSCTSDPREAPLVRQFECSSPSVLRRAMTEKSASDAVNQIEATHREISSKRIRELENLAQKITDSHNCECRELDVVMERFELFRSSLLPWLIREQYLLLPALKQRLSEEQAGAAYFEAYHGEFADMVRTAEADHNHLHMLANELCREVNNLANKGFCSQTIRCFAEVLEKFVQCLNMQFKLEDSVLLPCIDQTEPKS